MAQRIVRSPALSDYWRTTSLNDPRYTPARQRAVAAFYPALARAQAAGLVRSDVLQSDIPLLIGMLGAALRGRTDAERQRMARQALQILRRGLQPDAQQG